MSGQTQNFNFLDLKDQPTILASEKIPTSRNVETMGSVTMFSARESRINTLSKDKSQCISLIACLFCHQIMNLYRFDSIIYSILITINKIYVQI